jgi:DNA-binding response OmpR family regulator
VRVLLVEDDIRLAAALVPELRRAGHEVDHVTTGADALGAAAPDLVLLDLGLPDGDGLRICRQLRRDSEVAIIVLTARAAEGDRVAGLRGGADDYVVKPFGIAELLARVDAVMRRAAPRRAGVLTVGSISVDLDTHQVLDAATPISLTRKEFQLFVALAAVPGAVVTRERLVSQVWQSTWQGASRTLDVHIATLRTKLRGRVEVETVRGVGYRVVALP